MPTTPQLAKPAALVTNTGTPTLADSAGSSVQAVSASATSFNSTFKIGTNLYCVVADQGGHLQVYQSDLTGAVWAAIGAAAVQTFRGGGMCVCVNGTSLIVGYCRTFINDDFYFNVFSTVTNLWAGEQHYNTSINVGPIEGPYAIYPRPDGSIAFILGLTAGDVAPVLLVYSGGAFVVPTTFPHAAVDAEYCTSVMRASGVIDVFTGISLSAQNNQFSRYQVNLDNTISAAVVMAGVTPLLDWNNFGMEQAYLDSGIYYIAAGLKTAAFPTIWGRPIIVYGVDGAWTMTAELDTALDADFSVLDGNVLISGKYIIYFCRLINSAGSGYICRFGFAKLTEFTDPTKWTWETAYDFRVPAPAVPGEAGAYVPLQFKGIAAGVSLGDDNIARYAMTLTASQFVSLLLSATLPAATPAVPTDFPYIDVKGVPSIPINFHIASPAGMIWRQFCDKSKDKPKVPSEDCEPERTDENVSCD